MSRSLFELEIRFGNSSTEAEIYIRPAGELVHLLGEQIKSCVYEVKPELAEQIADQTDADPASIRLFNIGEERLGLEDYHVGDCARITFEERCQCVCGGCEC